MKMERKGFRYNLTVKKIREYQKIPIEKRLIWLYQGNILRSSYSKKIVATQNKFRDALI